MVATMEGRTHIVLVPGFAGFDALGQLEYYSNVTQCFHLWQAKRGGATALPRRPATRATLHYSPSFPTAGVTTRARLLETYLARRCARNEFQQDDTIVLIGHSTGGLDIRQLLYELTTHEDESVQVDGDTTQAWAVSCQHILELVRRVVFVSVPQRGANIADHVGRNHFVATWLVSALRLGFYAAQAQGSVSLLRASERWDERIRSGLLMAARDALLEVAQRDTTSRFTAAQARAAHMQIKLWLSHIDADFLAIDDLKTQGDEGTKSVARFSDRERAEELARLRQHDIATRSYATIGSCPFDEASLRRGEPPSWYDTLVASTANPAPAEVFYRVAYKLCTIGTLGHPQKLRARVFGSGELREIESWENDGIVNTASMLWPNAEATQLVACDHADIIGHYRRAEDPSVCWFLGSEPKAAPSARRCARKYHTYDMFGSDSPFGNREFQAVWEDILDFCVGASSRHG
jgi:triacylglycerol lipase